MTDKETAEKHGEDATLTSPSSKGDRVGYGHPPRHTQFRRGVSGNPSGRPRKATLTREFINELSKKVGDEDSTGGAVTKGQALVNNLIAAAIRDPKIALEIWARLERSKGGDPPADEDDLFIEKLAADEPDEAGEAIPGSPATSGEA
jgi:Family of unknown function (DUF5681)